MAGFFCILILPKEPQAFIANHLPNREQIENAKFSLNRCVLNKVPANSLFIKVGGRLCQFVLQVIREQGFTEAHAEITEKSLFFAILYSEVGFPFKAKIRTILVNFPKGFLWCGISICSGMHDLTICIYHQLVMTYFLSLFGKDFWSPKLRSANRE